VTSCSTVVWYQCFRRWKQHGPPKRWYPTTIIHDVTTQKTWTWSMLTVRVLHVSYWEESKYLMSHNWPENIVNAIPASQVTRPSDSTIVNLVIPSIMKRHKQKQTFLRLCAPTLQKETESFCNGRIVI